MNEKKKKFIGKKKTGFNQPITSSNQNNLPYSYHHQRQIPESLLNHPLLNQSIAQLLPSNYNFEIHKTIHQVIQHGVSTLALQMPEGLLQWSLIISDLIRKFAPSCQDVIVLGDVTYGACCVDDYTAKALGCQMLIHYGHSCLIPVDQTSIKTLYVFVEIGIDRNHLSDTIRANFPTCLTNQYFESEDHQDPEPSTSNRHHQKSLHHITIEGDRSTQSEIHLALVGTVQFVSAVQALKHDLEESPGPPSLPQITDASIHSTDQPPQQIAQPSSSSCKFRITIPQIKPLSPGEILGCTAPKLSSEIDAILYLGDGRFHLESIMIANPSIPAFRYDPYEKKITREAYDHVKMRHFRSRAIQLASQSLLTRQPTSGPPQKEWAVILGTLGRQGSLSVLKSISDGLEQATGGKRSTIPILLSELTAPKLSLFAEAIEVFVQTSCPRLSIDWGEGFFASVPLLNPFESKVSLGQAPGFRLDLNPNRSSHDDGLLESYPMDFYADHSLGDWTPRFRKPKPKASQT